MRASTISFSRETGIDHAGVIAIGQFE